ncbi:MAG: peptide chain release factor N(5)-glutamine methyltransferase [Clostridiales bacterium]|nr:peptide chain release factor N(5)-glutamine methyltransferase [Clostridiales bacterium]
MEEEKTVKEKKVKEKKPSLRRTMIGGQALLEGVMMRGKSSIAMAVRAPDGEIEISSSRLKPGGKARRVPIVRGVIAFVDSLVTGMRTMLKSAEVSTPEEETPSKGATSFAVFLGVVLALGLFIGLPFAIYWALDTFTPLHGNVLALSAIEGGVRLLIFILYLSLIRLMRDIKRTFMYHGAEHRTINCYEKGLPLTVENVQSCSTKHNRCGTTFLFFVVVFSIIVFALTNWGFAELSVYSDVFGKGYMKLIIRLALLPIVAGLSYELLRLLALLPDNWFTNALRAPGLALQKLSTIKPDDEMAECAIAAFNTVLELDENPNAKTIDFYERDFKKELKALREKLSEYPHEADFIYCELLDKKRGELDTVSVVKIGVVKKAREYAERRLSGEPLDYILGNSDFCGVKIKVDKRVLIPRFETEVLAEKTLEYIGGESKRVLDLCTGSGCIAAYLAKSSHAEIVAADISDDALSVAKTNLDGLGVNVVKSDMFENIDGKFDIIVTNPPYVRTFEIDSLAPEVTCQPRLALDGGEDGLHFYKIIAEKAGDVLNDGGVILAEVGYDQAQDVSKLFSAIGKTKIIKDLDGVDRIVVCEK